MFGKWDCSTGMEESKCCWKLFKNISNNLLQITAPSRNFCTRQFLSIIHEVCASSRELLNVITSSLELLHVIKTSGVTRNEMWFELDNAPVGYDGQCSVLGPLFFSIYINDLSDNLTLNSNVFTDDTPLLCQSEQ